jgi:ATP-dependent RNA helicase DDX24/MAK5
MQQKQRLKNVDGFNSSEDGILVATDVAARGLDLSLVDIVIHYSLPHSAETFVHRSGRTARARRSGFAVALVGPEDQKRYWQITKVLDFPKGFPDVGLDHKYQKRIKARINLATKIREHILKVNKEHAQYLWLKKTIDNADTTVDDYTLEELESREKDLNDARDDSGSDRSVKNAKKELNFLLRQPLVQKGTSLKYIASSRSDVAATLLDSSTKAETDGNGDNLLQRLMDSNNGVRRHMGGFNVDGGKAGKKKAKKGKKGILTKDDVNAAAKEATIG